MSSVVQAAEAPGTPVSNPPGLLRDAILRKPQALIGLSVLAIFIALALLEPIIFPGDSERKVGAVFEPPSASHVLGLDGGGSDMLALLIDGTRVSLLVGFLAAIVSALIGGLVGLLSGFFGGKTDTVLMRFTDYMLVIPDVPLMIVAAALFGRSLTEHHPDHRDHLLDDDRPAHPRAGEERPRAGLRSSRTGARSWEPAASSVSTCFRRLRRSSSPTRFCLVAYAIFAETFITFLGLGDPSLISWGRLIENAFTDDAILNEAWWTIVPPGVCVAIIVLASTMIGASIEDALNPRLAVGHLSVRRFGMRALPAIAAAGRPRRSAAQRRCEHAERSASERADTRDRGSPCLVRVSRATSSSTLCRACPSRSERASGSGSSASPAAGRRRRFSRSWVSCRRTRAWRAVCSSTERTSSAEGEATISSHRWQDIAMVFQGAMNAFNPVKTVGNQIVEPMELHDIAEGKDAWKRAGELLETVGIAASRARRYPHEFSGGMRQRAAIAMALACNPKVLLADEPTTALDVMVQAQILELLMGLTNDFGLSLVLVTHDLPVVAQVCERAAVMYAGEIMEVGPDGGSLPRPAPPVHEASLRGDAGSAR